MADLPLVLISTSKKVGSRINFTPTSGVVTAMGFALASFSASSM